MIPAACKVFPHYLIPKKLVTTIAGCFAKVRHPAVKNRLIAQFIKTYQVNMSEALYEQPEDYSCFNEFFIRQLKPGCRPLEVADILSPVDGTISELGPIQQGQLMQAKGRYYTVTELLGASEAEAHSFHDGHFATLYLSPRDYHRVHMPLDAQLTAMRYLPGALFSVQPATARAIPKLFARNERLVLYFQTSRGQMALVMVGATIVGAIGTRWHGDLQRGTKQVDYDYRQESPAFNIQQGNEVGYFKLGSTVILLFAQDLAMSWSPNLQAGSSIRFGQALGSFRKL